MPELDNPSKRCSCYLTVVSVDKNGRRVVARIRTMEFWITQTFNGISFGALLFLLAGGLSLIFGMMRIVNMTHGSYYLLGGYVGLTVIWRTGNFALAILAGALAIAIIGVAEWNAFLKRLGGQELGRCLRPWDSP